MAVDLRVLEAQEWVNDTYRGKPGFVDAPENGQTGWSTMYALTRALQIELGVAPPSNAFGPGTTAAVSAISPIATGSGAPVNVVKILQCAMWCKGYSAGNIDGDFGALLTAAVRNVQTDLGVASRPGFGTVDAKLFRTLLTMDAYIRVGAGTVEIRSIQQWLNATYIGRLNFQYLPTDGRFSRGVQTGLLYALQFELGLNDATANGAFGPTTRALLSARPPLVVGTVDGVTKFVHLFQAALTFNGYPVFFDGNFGPASSTETSTFQDFAALQVTGTGNYQTWAELLVSTGDPTRPVTAIDTATPLILASQPDNDTIDAAPMAASLVAQGYTIAGRYLVNAPGGTLDKRMRVDELAMVSAAGMGVVPFFQTTGSASSYFTRARGLTDGATAIEAARALGFGNSTIIYFAVDFDATDDQIASNVVPYFEGVRDALAGSEFRLGAYGTRNVCTTLSDLALATASYVAGLSSGWSGNLGFPLPRDWAFNQIQETTASVSNGTGIVSLGLDRVASSGRSDGARVSQAFTRSLARLQALANSWSASTGQDPSALMSYPFRQGRYEGLNWGLLAGPVDDSFVDDARAQMVEPGSWPLALRYDDPGGSKAAYSPHLMATLGALVHQGMPPLPGVVTLADVGGWLGDLWTATGEYLSPDPPKLLSGR